VLVNAHHVIQRNGSRILVVGVDDPVFSKDDLGAALDAAPRDPDLLLVLCHSPDLLERSALLREFQCPCILLTGHTHGGQIRLPFTLGKSDSRSGLTRRGNIHVYVNRGIGYVLPLRLFCPPEVLVLSLASGSRCPS
jgi:predicted MPP superfamily phosphohydrolase